MSSLGHCLLTNLRMAIAMCHAGGRKIRNWRHGVPISVTNIKKTNFPPIVFSGWKRWALIGTRLTPHGKACSPHSVPTSKPMVIAMCPSDGRAIGNLEHGVERSEEFTRKTSSQLIESAWEEMFAALLACQQMYGDCVVPNNMPALRLWCSRQRSAYKNNELSPERIQRLESIGFTWDALDAGWEQMFAALTAYKQAHGDCNVPASWDVNPELGQWCYVQRRTYRKNKISKDRVQRLEQLGFVWELLETSWDEMFAALKRYRQTHGDCKVPLKWKDDPKLGQWCSSQRANYKLGNLSVDRIYRLESLGFVWDQLAAVWNEMFAALTHYKRVYGDCNVPAVWPENPKLGMWCGTQRRDAKAEKLSPDRRDRLIQIGFRLTSPVRSEAFDETFS